MSNNKLSKIIFPRMEVNGETISGELAYDFITAADTYQSAKMKFDELVGDDISDIMKNHIINIVNTSSDASGQVLYILFGGIGITLFLLILTFFAALYWQNDPQILLKCFICAMVILVLSVLILYLWIQSVYDQTTIHVTKSFKDINQLSDDVKNAIITVLCSVNNF
jgi:hypothetical protein